MLIQNKKKKKIEVMKKFNEYHKVTHERNK